MVVRRYLKLRLLMVLGGSAALTINAPWVELSAQAHGAIATYETQTQVRVEAQFDGGTPMAEAQFIVYSPDDPKTPWLTGVTDEQGRFEFTPDLSHPGDWEVMVRQAGHGRKLVIPIGRDGGQASGTQSRAQTLLMGGVALWGFIGTALFFMRRPRPSGDILTPSETFAQEALSGGGVEGRG